MSAPVLELRGVSVKGRQQPRLDQIELSVQAGERLALLGPSGAGKSTHEDFIIAKSLDKASPKLVLACCNGEHIPKVVLELCQAGGDKQKFMEYEMEDVIVASVRPSGAPGGQEGRPIEEVSFRYGKIKFVYTIFDPQSGASAGYVQTHWNVKENKGG